MHERPSPAQSLASLRCCLTRPEVCATGFRSTRRTKLICTIGPASCSPGVLESLASSGMNVARLNMCHGTHEWHIGVIERIRQLNKSKGCAGSRRRSACALHVDYPTVSKHNMRMSDILLLCRYSVAIMVDTEGSEVHTNELEQPIKAEVSFCCALQGCLHFRALRPQHYDLKACRPLTTSCTM